MIGFAGLLLMCSSKRQSASCLLRIAPNMFLGLDYATAGIVCWPHHVIMPKVRPASARATTLVQGPLYLITLHPLEPGQSVHGVLASPQPRKLPVF